VDLLDAVAGGRVKRMPKQTQMEISCLAKKRRASQLKITTLLHIMETALETSTQAVQ
jgi:hypothetical protein